MTGHTHTYEDIGRLDVAMDDVVGLHVHEGLNNLSEQPPSCVLVDTLPDKLFEVVRTMNNGEDTHTHVFQRLVRHVFLK